LIAVCVILPKLGNLVFYMFEREFFFNFEDNIFFDGWCHRLWCRFQILQQKFSKIDFTW